MPLGNALPSLEASRSSKIAWSPINFWRVVSLLVSRRSFMRLRLSELERGWRDLSVVFNLWFRSPLFPFLFVTHWLQAFCMIRAAKIYARSLALSIWITAVASYSKFSESLAESIVWSAALNGLCRSRTWKLLNSGKFSPQDAVVTHNRPSNNRLIVACHAPNYQHTTLYFARLF